jgi:hypothetical protein
MMAGAMVAAGIVGGLASWMWHLGHFDLYLAIEAVLMLAASFLMKYLMRAPLGGDEGVNESGALPQLG